MRTLEQLQDDYADWRIVYSRSVIESRRDLQEEEARILAGINAAREREA